MKIIGHRGVPSIALENSLDSIQKACKLNLYAIEIDVHATKDKNFIVSHDKDINRISNGNGNIEDLTVEEIEQFQLLNGEKIPTLDEAYNAAHGSLLLIEAKGSSWATDLTNYIKKYNLQNINIISFNHNEMVRFHEIMPHISVYLIERTKIISTIRLAYNHKLKGIDINFWFLNPLTYWYSRYLKLDIIVYTVNNVWIARFLRLLYPKIAITTDIPQRFIKSL
ncbi:MAG: glycerophosphodiester phosphodiesterase family protein [Candidatus Saccharimonadales bacterium]